MTAAAIAILEALVGFDTTSTRSNLPIVDWIVAHLEPHGARISLTYDDARTKANVLASFGPARTPGVVLSGHTDVVPVDGQDWSVDPFVLTARGGDLYGRGTCDMKGFIACCLHVATALGVTDLARPVHIALSYDEEVGCLGVGRLIADLVEREATPVLAIVGEPTGMRVCDRHRGFVGVRSVFSGRAAHSSDPGAGASAITPASALVAALAALGGAGDPATAERTTFNVGRIAGGSAINVVPERCAVDWEFRPAPQEDPAALEATIRDWIERTLPFGVRHSMEVVAKVPPLPPDPSGEARRLVEGFGARRPDIRVPFGTEAGFFQSAGIPAVVCGPGSIGAAHQPDERVPVADLAAATVFLDRVREWAAAP